MTEWIKYIVEEPVGANSCLTALDETHEQLVLAEFEMQHCCRYSFLWPRNISTADVGRDVLLNDLVDASSLPTRYVLGWKHDSLGYLRVRQSHLRRLLKKQGWDVYAEEGIGIATATTMSIEPRVVRELAKENGLGWFVAFGDWGTVEALKEAPFRNTLRSFCWNHRLAPSIQFLSGIENERGGLSYIVSSDDVLPSLVFIFYRPVRGELSTIVNRPIRTRRSIPPSPRSHS